MTTSRLGGAQDVPLLKTKLYIPPVRPERVPRPHLVSRLAAGLGQSPYGFARKLTLISAPAGFGKTALLSEWIHTLGPHRDAPLRVAWVSLDKGDNDPVQFWTYVVAALQTIPHINGTELGQAVLAMVRSTQPPPMETLLSGLINELVEITDPFVLILDDLHEITNPQINDALAFLLENQPPQMHLLISSRADPPWPLARWRASDQVIELRTDDLRFTSREAAAFLNDVMELDLSAVDIAALDARTEGWIAGLQLAALALQGTQSTGGRDARSFLKAFSGSHRFVLDYLMEEVLDRQPGEIQEFLLRTSVLERLTAPLCDAVRFGEAKAPSSSSGTAVHSHSAAAHGRQDSQAILDRLERANLFLVPLDDERRWYRYHNLFADLLRSRLQQSHPEEELMLHLRASHWHEQNGHLAEAVEHALQIHDAKRVAHLIEGNGVAILERGEFTTLVGWLDALPEDIVRSHPWLCVAYAWVLVYAGQLDTAESYLRDAEAALPSPARPIAGQIATIRAYAADLTGDKRGTAELARKALEYLPEADRRARGLAMSLLIPALYWVGDPAAADEVADQAITLSRTPGDSLMAVRVLTESAGLQLARGRLREAAATCHDALQLADEHAMHSGWRLPITGHAHALLATVLAEWNDLEPALRHARESVELCNRWKQAEDLVHSYVSLSVALQAIGDPAGALVALQEARQVASGISTHYADYVAAHQARLLLAQGNLPAASRWAASWEGVSPADERLPFFREHEFFVLARVLIAQGRQQPGSSLDSALAWLSWLQQKAQTFGAWQRVILSLVLQALALQAQGRDKEALAALARALALGEPEGYVRTFIDEGAPMGRLLRQAVTQGIAATQGVAVDYAGKLLAALEQETRRAATPLAVSQGALPPLVEPLSPREAEVLRLLTTHLSHAEIAEELVLSVNTIRSHIKSIYSKLDVHSRMEAVQRATELGLLD
jgi:LuxR family maltose regulon positive regulatory protein